MRRILLLILLFATPLLVKGEEVDTVVATSTLALAESGLHSEEVVDRVSGLKPMHKGEYVGSITASFGNFSNSNSSMLLLLQGIDASGSISSIKPSVGYFYSDHAMFGLRFEYTNVQCEISSASIDFGSINDLVLDVPYVKVALRDYAYGIYHRSYTKIDKRGQFELFSEIDALYSYGSYNIAQDFTGDNEYLRSKTSSLSIGFSPGLAVNITPNVATFVSLGLGGLTYNKVMQYDANGDFIGQRKSSQFDLNVDLFAINFGVAFHFWTN